MVKGLKGKVGGFTLTAWVAILATPQFFLSSWLFEEGQIDALKSAGWIGWGVVIYMGVIMAAVGHAIWYRLLGTYNVNQVMPFLLLLPVVSILDSMLFLGERLALIEVIGCLKSTAAPSSYSASQLSPLNQVRLENMPSLENKQFMKQPPGI